MEGEILERTAQHFAFDIGNGSCPLFRQSLIVRSGGEDLQSAEPACLQQHISEGEQEWVYERIFLTMNSRSSFVSSFIRRPSQPSVFEQAI